MPTQDVLAYLHALPRYAGTADAAYKPGLERMRALLGAMGDPQAAFESVHIAGTNGKGSTAAFVAAVATAGGRRTGLHTSPHLFHLRERMRIGATAAPEDWLAEAVARFRPDFDAVAPSFFEATTALSLLYFAERAVDLAVVEVGLGGRLDATNVLRPALALITTIGLEHTDILGDTLGAIAREKAGIVKPGVPVLTAVENPEALSAIRAVAEAQGAPLIRVQEAARVLRAERAPDGFTLDIETERRRYEGLRLGLAGAHQIGNARLALCAAERLGLGEGAIRTGLREVKHLAGLRGRGEVLGENPLVVADVAHNADGLAAALALAKRQADGGRLTVLFGAMRDKDVAVMTALLAKAGATVIPAHLDAERALRAEEVARLLEARGVRTEAPASVPEGVARFRQRAAAGDALLITGSHVTVAALGEAAFETALPRGT